MSLCTTFAECMYFSALSSWYIMYCLWISSKILALMTACRSVSASILSIVHRTALTHVLKDQVDISIIFCLQHIGKVDNVLMILLCFIRRTQVEGNEELLTPSSCKNIISRKVLCASVAFWNASNTFFNATVSRVFLSNAFHTIPYAFR
jgi:hypothetical protein